MNQRCLATTESVMPGDDRISDAWRQGSFPWGGGPRRLLGPTRQLHFCYTSDDHVSDGCVGDDDAAAGVLPLYETHPPIKFTH